MKLCIGGKPPAQPKGRAQGLALGWGHNDTTWDISRASAGLLQGEHEEREQQPLFFVGCLEFVLIGTKHQLSLLQRNSEGFFTGFPLNPSPF